VCVCVCACVENTHIDFGAAGNRDGDFYY